MFESASLSTNSVLRNRLQDVLDETALRRSNSKKSMRVAALLIAAFGASGSVYAQGQHTDKAVQAVELANQVTANTKSHLEAAFLTRGAASFDERTKICGDVARAVHIDDEAINYILRAISRLPDNNTPRYMHRDIYSAQGILMRGAATYRLDRGDAYLAHGCLEQADKFYRDVMTRFADGPFEGFRSRAAVGIEDVREQRKKVGG